MIAHICKNFLRTVTEGCSRAFAKTIGWIPGQQLLFSFHPHALGGVVVVGEDSSRIDLVDLDAPPVNSLHLRREEQRAGSGMSNVEGIDAHSVPAYENTICLQIVQAERKVSVNQVHHLLKVLEFLVQHGDDFAIAPHIMAVVLQVGIQQELVVVDLSVNDQNGLCVSMFIFSNDGLRTSLRFHHSQPSMTERNPALTLRRRPRELPRPAAKPVRPAVSQALRCRQRPVPRRGGLPRSQQAISNSIRGVRTGEKYSSDSTHLPHVQQIA
mmetsp:Transcript_17499/g.70893  ORF Transcript_17499/g.70893 Transcript_17499/m.70893 type:complete len:269 (-) Transcript_17499:96-902(-)